jgi:hypothetical protein
MANTHILDIFGSNLGRDTDYPDLRVFVIFRSSTIQMLNLKNVYIGPHLIGSLFNALFHWRYFHLRVMLVRHHLPCLCTSFCSDMTYISQDDRTQWRVPIHSCPIDLPECPVFSFPTHYTLRHLCDLGSDFFMHTILRCLSVMFIYAEIICGLRENVTFSLYAYSALIAAFAARSALIHAEPAVTSCSEVCAENILCQHGCLLHTLNRFWPTRWSSLSVSHKEK